MLESVHGAESRLQNIWNCAFQCHYDNSNDDNEKKIIQQHLMMMMMVMIITVIMIIIIMRMMMMMIIIIIINIIILTCVGEKLSESDWRQSAVGLMTGRQVPHT